MRNPLFSFELDEKGKPTFIKDKKLYVIKKLSEKYGFDMEEKSLHMDMSGAELKSEFEVGPTSNFQYAVLERFLELAKLGETNKKCFKKHLIWIHKELVNLHLIPLIK